LGKCQMRSIFATAFYVRYTQLIRKLSKHSGDSYRPGFERNLIVREIKKKGIWGFV
jgi:hypothetical protein